VARDLSPGVRTVARIADDGQTRYERFVDETVYPERAGARTAANGIEGDDVHVFDDVVGDLDIMAVRVEEGAPAAERPLREIQFPTGALVISDDDGDRVAIPDTTLTPGRRYVVAVESDVVDEVLNLLRG
jgi:trk system potassium uptake protein TrkA